MFNVQVFLPQQPQYSPFATVFLQKGQVIASNSAVRRLSNAPQFLQKEEAGVSLPQFLHSTTKYFFISIVPP